VSKNVAVFVDVANIFYAAKAAGIDIDYVTLLKSATAGRDFVRAYAYTGLDPENENQRQFHSFLARNGYKVISKDIRKYGDGRIKANLDIELVVDMMKTARNLDIAVVVSGDGDFAPAIRAVQEQGVRVEVISFRGNTSSDLIEVADQFTDIAQIARVEKASARSGRRVAAEGDMSMTEVPEKETEGAPRRRRGRPRDERPVEAPAALASVTGTGARRGQGNLVALPGERLSRRADEDAIDSAAEPVAVGDISQMPDVAEGEAGYAASSENGRDAALEDGQRRRRRRGGRGRGRGRRGEETFVGGDGAGIGAVAGAEPDSGVGAGAEAGVDEEDEEFQDIAPTQPPHHTFGSVWDSQIGVPSAPTAATSLSAGPRVDDPAGEDEDLDEPEVPEYLLAERRQGGQRQGQGGRGRMTGNRSAYQAALNRERYGRGTPQPTFGGGGGGGGGGARPDRRPDRGPDRGPDRDRGRDRGRGGRPQQGRPMDRGPRPDTRQMAAEPRSAEPWSEVPPELEELLRAELARKAPVSESQSRPEAPAAQVSEPDAPAEVAKPKARPTRTRTAKAPAKAPAAEVSTAEPGSDAPVAEKTAAKPKPRATRARTTKAAAPAAEADAGAADETAAAPKKPATRRRKTAASAEEG
jgi:uncharacterized LabA/DUF88 family protein